MDRLRIFSGSSYPELGESVAECLGIAPSPIKVHPYKNGCFEVVLGENVRGCHVFLIQTSLPDPQLLHYHLFELLQMVNAAFKASAKEITVVMPHLSYARSDKKWTGRMPIVATLLAAILRQAGMRRMVGVDFHSPQFESSFSTLTVVDHLRTLPLIGHHLKEKGLSKQEAFILPGDEGFHKRAESLGELLGLEVGSVEKTRLGPEEVAISAISGEVENKKVIVFDDEICTASTMAEITRQLQQKQVRGIIVVATHALFQGKAKENLSSPLVEEVVVTDTVPIPSSLKEELPLSVIPVAPLLAQAIREIYEEGSVSKLFP